MSSSLREKEGFQAEGIQSAPSLETESPPLAPPAASVKVVPQVPGAPSDPLVARLVADLVVFWNVFAALLFVSAALWLALSWSNYSAHHAQNPDLWRVGGTQLIEVTLVAEDVTKLACASDSVFDGLTCGYHPDGTPFGSSGADDQNTLRPYNTTKNELFLAAGLWSSPALRGFKSSERFSIACSYTIVGVAKSVQLRWSPTSRFEPLKTAVPLGRLSNCVFPQ